jgi:uncharacterized protein YfaS (alpha-2-macroglobulin family)
VDGDKNADPYGSFEIMFSAPIDPATVMKSMRMSPEPKATDVYTYYNRSDRRFVIQFNRKPSTDYTVVIGAGISDLYGNTLGRDTTVKFTTKPLDPQVYLNTPGEIGTYSAYTETKLYAVYRNIAKMDFELARMSLQDFARVTGQEGYQVWQNYQPAPGSILRQWSADAAKDVTLNETAFSRLCHRRRRRQTAAGVYYLQASSPVGKTDQGGPSAYHDCGYGQYHVQNGRTRGAGVGDGYAVRPACAKRRRHAVRPKLPPVRLRQDGQGRPVGRPVE